MDTSLIENLMRSILNDHSDNLRIWPVWNAVYRELSTVGLPCGLLTESGWPVSRHAVRWTLDILTENAIGTTGLVRSETTRETLTLRMKLETVAGPAGPLGHWTLSLQALLPPKPGEEAEILVSGVLYSAPTAEAPRAPRLVEQLQGRGGAPHALRPEEECGSLAQFAKDFANLVPAELAHLHA